MRPWSTIFLLVLAASNLEAQRLINSYAFGSSLNTGLVSYWKLEEASGTRVDSEPTPTAQDLTDTNTVTQTTGIIGNAAFFTSANDESLSAADSADLSTGNIDFSLTAWIKFTTVSSSQTAVAHYNSAVAQRAWRIHYDSTSGRLQWIVSNDGTAVATREATTFGAPSTNVWIFIFVSHDSVANTINISINNGTVNSTAHTTGVHDSTAPFNIGATANNIFHFNGAIDSVGFWKRVLTPAEITRLWNFGASIDCCPFP